MFKVGTKVICIDDSIKSGQEGFVAKAYKNWVKVNNVYTIRGIFNNKDIVTGILLEEVVNGAIYIHLIDDWSEPMFATTRFRELTSYDKLEETEEDEETILENIDIEELIIN